MSDNAKESRFFRKNRRSGIIVSGIRENSGAAESSAARVAGPNSREFGYGAIGENSGAAESSAARVAGPNSREFGYGAIGENSGAAESSAARAAAPNSREFGYVWPGASPVFTRAL